MRDGHKTGEAEFAILHAMKRLSLEVGPYEVNCSLLCADDRAWIVDPGADADLICDLLTKNGLTPAAILLTHAHFDHIGAVPDLQAKFPGLPVYIHPNDAAVITHPLNQCPPDYPPVAMPANVRDARTLAEEKLPFAIEVVETPGHTPGGVCYLLPDDKLLLSGDTLFAGSVGRTDLPGGDMPTLMASLSKLVALPDDTTVVPGHGPTTTIASERRYNPFLQR